MIEIDRGALMQAPLPVLLAQAYRERRTGVIQITPRQPEQGADSEGVDQIWLRGGYPVTVLLSNGPGVAGDRLGQVLYEIGDLDRDRFLRAQALAPQGPERIGAVMLQARLVDRNALKRGLRAQVRRRLHRLFAVEDGTYQCFSGEHDLGHEGGEPLRCDPVRATYFGVLRAWPAGWLQGALADVAGQEVQVTAQTAAEVSRWLATEEERVLELLSRGAWALDELPAAAGLPAQAVLAMVYTLKVHGLLEVRPVLPGRPPRAARPKPPVEQLPARPTDEPLPPEALAVRRDERLVLMQAGAPGAVPVSMRRDRVVRVVPIVPTAAPTASTMQVPSGATPPPAGTLQGPPPEEAEPETPGPRPPPLRTSIPTSRLKR